MPNITDLTNNIGNARIFTKLDLLKGYFQVPVHPDVVSKTAIITPFGSYVFYYFTFGLRNSGANFQRLMDSIFGQTSNGLVYIDDLLVFSDTPEEHEQHLRTVLSKLQANGLIMRPDKCVFGAQEVDFLGHKITAKGILPLPSKVSVIKTTQSPEPPNNCSHSWAWSTIIIALSPWLLIRWPTFTSHSLVNLNS